MELSNLLLVLLLSMGGDKTDAKSEWSKRALSISEKNMNKSLASKLVDGIRLNNRPTICIECANKSWREKEKVKRERKKKNEFINTSQNIFGAKSCEKLPIMIRVSKSYSVGRGWKRDGREKSEGNNFRLKSNAFHLHRAFRLFLFFPLRHQCFCHYSFSKLFSHSSFWFVAWRNKSSIW